MDQYLAKIPTGAERIEQAIANFHAQYVNTHLKEGVAPVPVSTFLPYLNAFAPKIILDGRYNESDKAFLQALGGFRP